MRNFKHCITSILLGMLFLTVAACDETSSTTTGSLVAEIDLENLDLLAESHSPLDRLCKVFHPRAAVALPNLGFQSNSYPLNQFLGSKSVQGGLQAVLIAPDSSFIAQGTTDDAGRVTFNDVPSGFQTLLVTGSNGNNYHIPVHVGEGTTSRTRALIYRHTSTGNIFIVAKTIHDGDNNGLNDDSFSYSVFNRQANEATGGRVHLHLGNETKVDANGDGDFLDVNDKSVIEPDDDGVASGQGDGDEDNDGLLDNVDPDIDGDEIGNAGDEDMDGDGMPNQDDPYPNGITPDDDFVAPGLAGWLSYPGIQDLRVLNENSVRVSFAAAVEDKNPPVTYVIYYSTTTPIDFETASKKVFRPVAGGDEETLSCDISGLVTGQTYYFAVRAMDSAQPPNMDKNTNEMGIKVEL